MSSLPNFKLKLRIVRPRKLGSALEERFALFWIAVGGVGVAPLVREYRFDGVRKWRFDFAHVESKTAIELEGGSWSGGAHSRGKGFEQDCEKYNAATMQGWRVIRLTTDMVGTVWATKILKFVISMTATARRAGKGKTS